MRDVLWRNLFWSFISQFTNLLIPLISFPILVRKLGFEIYGEMIIHLLIWQTICTVIDYNFNSIGVQRVLAASFADRGAVNLNLFLSKGYLFCLGIIILCISYYVYFKDFEIMFLVWGLLYITGYLLTNQMWYSVHEKFYILAGINFVSKLIFLIGVYFFVNNLYTALLMQSMSLAISACLSLLITRYPLEFRASMNMYIDALGFLTATYSAFVANFSGYILSNIPLYLGPLLLDPVNFGIYAFLDRLVRVFLSGYSAINQVLFRKTLTLATLGINVFKNYIVKLLTVVSSAYVLLCIVGIVTSVYLSPLLFKVKLENYLIFFIPLVIWSLLSVVNSIIGYHYLQALKRFTEYQNIMILSLLLTIALILVLGNYYKIGGFVAGIVLSELFVLCVLLSVFRRKA